MIYDLENQYLLYDSDFYKKLEHDKTINLKGVLYRLSYIIEFLVNNRQCTDLSRKNLYNILSVIRFGTDDINLKEEVNRLITILNKSDTCYYNNYIVAQYFLHFDGFLCPLDNVNASYLEHFIFQFLKGDLHFAKSLIYDSNEDFKSKYYDDIYSIINLNYILLDYPEILNNQAIKLRIENYLNNILEKFKNVDVNQEVSNINSSHMNKSNLYLLAKKVFAKVTKYKVNIGIRQAKELLCEFLVKDLIYGNNYLIILNRLDNITLAQLLYYFEKFIYNHHNIYNADLKERFHEIFKYYVKLLNNPNILIRITNLENYLSQSTDENLCSFYKEQYHLRYSFYGNQSTDMNFSTIEEMISESFEYDYHFLQELLFEDIDDFVSNNVFNDVLFSNICYLKNKYPDILKCKRIMKKIYKLLSANQKEYKKLIRRNIHDEYYEQLNDKSATLQKILKLTR